MAKRKKVAKKATNEPMQSPIIQAGIVFIFVAAIVLFAYAYKNFP